jgi:hypothetical protein
MLEHQTFNLTFGTVRFYYRTGDGCPWLSYFVRGMLNTIVVRVLCGV